MPRKMPALGKYLEWNNGSIRVTVAVPRELHGKLTTRLKQSLGTSDPKRAEELKGAVLRQLRAKIEEARRAAGLDPVLSEALSFREFRAKQGPRYAAVVLDDGEEVEYDIHEEAADERARQIEERQGFEKAKLFYEVATSKSTPISSLLDRWQAEDGIRPRTKVSRRQAVSHFLEWMKGQGVADFVEQVSGELVGRYVSGLHAGGMAAATINKYVSHLSSLWRWLKQKHYVKENPWQGAGMSIEKDREKRGVIEARPFTDEEARALLYGPAAQREMDVQWIGALSGMRLDEICRLKVGDCRGGWFNVRASKTKAGVRKVPIHKALKDRLARLTEGKAAGDYLIDGLADGDAETGRERSMPVSKAYTRYIERMGFAERAPGQRRSAVSFHSWRRWFVTKAWHGGIEPHVIAKVVGHSVKAQASGLAVTMGVYAGDAAEDDKIACVAAVIAPQPVTRAEAA